MTPADRVVEREKRRRRALLAKTLVAYERLASLTRELDTFAPLPELVDGDLTALVNDLHSAGYDFASHVRTMLEEPSE